MAENNHLARIKQLYGIFLCTPMQELEVTDLELSRRLERAEGFAGTRFVEARAAANPASDGVWTETAGAYLMYDGVDSPVTQSFGLGLNGLPSADEMDRVEEFFFSRGAAAAHEVSPLADTGMLGLLHQRGYRPVELTSLLVQRLAGYRPRAGLLAAREAQPGERSLWARTAAEGWGDSIDLGNLEDLMQVLVAAENLKAYFACIDGRPVATAAMAVHDGVALLAGAATVPEWRKRGAQRALLEYRLAEAARGGCELAMMGAAPGSASQRNAERHGFRIAYTRIKWALRPR